MIKRLFLLLLLGCTSSQAAVVLDQYNFAWRSDDTPRMAIGGNAEQMLAQTFTAGRNGVIDHVSMVLSCSSVSEGMVTVAIHELGADGLPVGHGLGAASRDSASLAAGASPTIQDFHMPSVRLNAGAEYALVVRGPTSLFCSMPRGAGPMFHSAGVGPAYFDARPNPPGWVPLTLDLSDSYLAFWVYVDTGGPDSPRYCDFQTADGVPNTWILNDMPVCGCLVDSVLREHRCWFAMPELVLWREMPLPWEEPDSKARWTVLPMGEDFPGLSVQEFGADGKFFSEVVDFDGKLKPGKSVSAKSRYQGAADTTEVIIVLDSPQGPVNMTFRTLLNIPEPGQQQ